MAAKHETRERHTYTLSSTYKSNFVKIRTLVPEIWAEQDFGTFSRHLETKWPPGAKHAKGTPTPYHLPTNQILSKSDHWFRRYGPNKISALLAAILKQNGRHLETKWPPWAKHAKGTSTPYHLPTVQISSKSDHRFRRYWLNKI